MVRVRRFLESTVAVTLLLSFMSIAAVATLRGVGGLEWLELQSYDLLIRARSGSLPIRPNIVVVGANDEDLERWGWPLNDGTLARLLEGLTAKGARAVGVDIYRDRPIAPGTDVLETVLGASDRIVWGSKFGEGQWRGVPPPAPLIGTDREGFVDVVLDPGGHMRRSLLFLDDGETVSYSLSLRLALRFLADEGIFPQPDEEDERYINLGATTFVPLDRNFGGYAGVDANGYQYMLDFASGPSPFPIVSVSEAIEGGLTQSDIEGRIVIVGVAAQTVKDTFQTPFSQSADWEQSTFGAVLHAHATNQLIRHALDGVPATRALDDGYEILWILASSLLGGLLAIGVHAAWPFWFLFVGAFVLQAWVGYQGLMNAWWLPVVPGALAALLSGTLAIAYLSLAEKARRSLLMRMFATHVSGAIADELWRRREEFLEAGRPRPRRLMATVLFSDLRDFTTISERLDPDDLMHWLNRYTEAMATIVSEHDGIVDKFIGDAVMALFGVPIERRDPVEISSDTSNAVRCAQAMAARLESLNAEFAEQGLPPAHIRVGIQAGSVVVGSIGSADRMQYTAIGDTVNVASRLESLSNDVGIIEDTDADCRILVGDSVAEKLDGAFRLTPLGKFSLKGKGERISVYHVSHGSGTIEDRKGTAP